MSLTNYQLFTLHDAVEHVLDQIVGADGSPRNRRQAMRAVLEAYQELPFRRDWRYYYRPLRINTVASQTTGTVAFDLTGGAYERMLTLSSATWPTDAEKYVVSISGVRYEVDSYKSSPFFHKGS